MKSRCLGQACESPNTQSPNGPLGDVLRYSSSEISRSHVQRTTLGIEASKRRAFMAAHGARRKHSPEKIRSDLCSSSPGSLVSFQYLLKLLKDAQLRCPIRVHIRAGLEIIALPWRSPKSSRLMYLKGRGCKIEIEATRFDSNPG